jgi:hypothetical protein
MYFTLGYWRGSSMDGGPRCSSPHVLSEDPGLLLRLPALALPALELIRAGSAAMSRRDVRELHRELQQCQRRLGTQAEAPEDFRRVLELAHELSNTVTAEFLSASAESAAPVSLFAIWKRRLLGK